MIGRAEIAMASERIAGRVRRTPALSLPEGALADIPGSLSFKLENCQITGSFKPRGVFNRVLSEPSLPTSGLTAASGGNHALAVAFAARALAALRGVPSLDRAS
jgi:threonine dehydratase